jgi:hypothetical protein
MWKGPGYARLVGTALQGPLNAQSVCPLRWLASCSLHYQLRPHGCPACMTGAHLMACSRVSGANDQGGRYWLGDR